MRNRPVPDMVGTHGVLEMMGCSRQNLWILRTSGRFLPPVVSLNATDVWWRSDVQRWIDNDWDHQVGRRPKVRV